jgi:hypothetical protein
MQCGERHIDTKVKYGADIGSRAGEERGKKKGEDSDPRIDWSFS